MFKRIQKALLISFFSCSFIFPMSQLSRIGLARTVGQSTSFRNCLPARCPMFLMKTLDLALEVEAQAVAETSNTVNTAANQALEANQQPATMDNQNISYVKIEDTVYGVSIDPNTGERIVHCCLNSNNLDAIPFNKSQAIDLVQQHSSSHDATVAPDLKMQMVADKLNAQAAIENHQSNQHLSEIAYNAKMKTMVASLVTKQNSELSADIANLQTTVQSKTFSQSSASQFMKEHASSSNEALKIEQGQHTQKVFQLERELQSLIEKNSNVSIYYQLANKFDTEVLADCVKNFNLQDKHALKEALTLEVAIKDEKAIVAAIDCKIKQEAEAFTKSLHDQSLKQLQETTIPSLIEQKEIAQKNLASHQDLFKKDQKTLNDLQDQQDKLKHSSIFSKGWRMFTRDDIEKILTEKIQTLQATQDQRTVIIKSLKSDLAKYNDQITQAQIVAEKKEELAILNMQHVEEQNIQYLDEQPEQQQEIDFLEEQTHSQYDSLDLSNQHGSDSVQNDRQEALSVTEEQDYQIHNHEYCLSSQAAAYLQNHDIDIPQEHHFKGTTLQQQLHKEYCSIIEQAAEKQAQLFYQSDLLTQCVVCADTAHSANTLGLIQAVVSLNNMGFVLLEAAHAVLHVGQRIAQNTAHVITYPEETLQAMSKAALYALETMLLNFSPPLPYPARDERNAEIAATLKNLSNQFKELTGLQQIKAVTQVIAEWVMAKPLISATGTMMGISPETVALTANLLKTKNNSSSTLNLESATCKAGQNVAKKCKILTTSEVLNEIQKVGGKISKSKIDLYDKTKLFLEEICTKINTKIEPSLLEQYNTMTKIPGTNMSVCMDIEHIVNVKYPLVIDKSQTYHTVKLTGGHLAGTMSKLAQEGLVEIKSCTEFTGGCIEYQVEDLITKTKFTHTEFPASWTIEKIAQETKFLLENAILNGSFGENINKPVIAMTSEGFNLKIITDLTPKAHDCISIENTVNRHIITSHPYKGKL